MTDHDDFFERLRGDAAALRHQVDDATLERIRERIHERVGAVPIESRPAIADVIASWFRPLAAGLVALALAAAIGLTLNVGDGSFGEVPMEIVMGGDTYSVGN